MNEKVCKAFEIHLRIAHYFLLIFEKKSEMNCNGFNSLGKTPKFALDGIFSVKSADSIVFRMRIPSGLPLKSLPTLSLSECAIFW